MANALSELSVEQLKRAIEIKEQIEDLQNALEEVLGGAVVTTGNGRRRLGRRPGKGRRKMSAAAKAAISAAQKARWAKKRGETAPGKPAAERKKKLSPARLAALAKAREARWGKARAAKAT